MSWKSLVCAGLFCALVTPAWAVPTLTVDLVRSGGLAQLDSSGDWQWLVTIEGDGAGAMAAELAFILTDAELISASAPDSGIGNSWDHVNPAVDPAGIFGDFSWLVDNVNGDPEGLQSDPDPGANEVFASLGSKTFLSQEETSYVLIKTDGPGTVVGSLTTSIEWGGAFGGNGRISQSNLNNDIYAGTLSKTAHSGDSNLDGNVNGLDLDDLILNFGAAGSAIWHQADWTGEGDVNGLDLDELILNFGFSGVAPGGGAGSASAAVPEPSSLALLLVGSLLLLRRKRR